VRPSNRALLHRNLGVAALALIAFGAILLLRESYYMDTVVTVGIFFIMLMGLDLFIGYTGQLSLGHNGFFALGAYASAIMTVKMGVSPWLAMPVGMAISLLAGLMLSAPFIRLRGFYLALVTLAFGLIIHGMTLALPDVTSGAAGIGGIPKLSLGGIALNTDFNYALFVWALAIPIFWLCSNMMSSRIGRVFRVIRDDELPGQTLGIDTTRHKTVAFLLSAVLAALSGSLYTHFHGSLTPDAVSIFVMFELILMLFIGGRETIWGGLLGVVLIKGLPEVLVELKEYKTLAYGVVFLLVIVFMEGGIAGFLIQTARKLEAFLFAPSEPSSTGTSPWLATQETKYGPGSRSGPLLDVVGLKKTFGGVEAVSNVSFTVSPGEIKSLVGPNGAGKTTAFNVISGILRPDAGRINFDGHDITGRTPKGIAALGVGRTFQTPRVFGHMTVLENIMVGRHRMAAAGILGGALSLPGANAEENGMRQISLDLLAFVSLTHKAQSRAGSLPLGEKRLLEVARALAAEPKLLLLDEPASGLNDVEKELFSKIILQLKALGIATLLVEHDMNFVMKMSDNILVMDYGMQIAQGTPEEIQSNQRVIEVYLGSLGKKREA